jgi:hypothetical protein
MLVDHGVLAAKAAVAAILLLQLRPGASAVLCSRTILMLYNGVTGFCIVGKPQLFLVAFDSCNVTT